MKFFVTLYSVKEKVPQFVSIAQRIWYDELGEIKKAVPVFIRQKAAWEAALPRKTVPLKRSGGLPGRLGGGPGEENSMNHSFVPHRLTAALCALALVLLCGCGQAKAPAESAAEQPPSPVDASGQAADDSNRLVVASSQNLAYGSCLPGREQPPAVWRVLRAGQEVFRTEGGDVYVLRNWQPDAPDLFVVSDTLNYEGNADNHYTVYDADGTQLLEQKGAIPSVAAGRQLLLLCGEWVQPSADMIYDCFYDLDTGSTSCLGVRNYMVRDGEYYLFYGDRAEQVDAELNVLANLPDTDYHDIEQVKDYQKEMQQNRWPEGYAVRMEGADAQPYLYGPNGEPVSEQPVYRILNDGQALLSGEGERYSVLDAVSGRIEKSDTTHRYQFYSDRVKIYQDDTMVWGAFYLECPTGVYESAMAGVFEDGSAWYQKPVDVNRYDAPVHLLDPDGNEVLVTENVNNYPYSAPYGCTRTPYLVCVKPEGEIFVLRSSGSRTALNGQDVSYSEALEKQGLWLTLDRDSETGRTRRMYLAKEDGTLLLEGDQLTYNEAENGLWCIDGDMMGLRTLDGQWVWQVPAEGAVLMN